MTARERVLATLNGEKPDKVPIMAFDFLRAGSQGGWLRRLAKRGLGITRFCYPYQPYYRGMSFYFEDVKYTQINYVEGGLRKYRQVLETPVGVATGVIRCNPIHDVPFAWGAQEEYFVKEPSDWRVMTYIFNRILANLAPNYDAFMREDDEVGETGICFARVDKTPFQRAWVELATLERVAIDFAEQPEELVEFLAVQKKLHIRQAEIAAESPAPFIDIMDHITNVISPRYYRQYCNEYYRIYSEALAGTGKVLGAHMDGRFSHLKDEISQGPLQVIESFTVPPVGDVGLTEARNLWPDKIFFINCPPHVNNGSADEVRNAYIAIQEERGDCKGLLIEHSEDIPLGKVEMNLSVALDVFGY